MQVHIVIKTFAIPFFLVLFSCSEKLTRKEAERQINSYDGIDIGKVEITLNNTVCLTCFEDFDLDHRARWRILEKENFVEILKIRKGGGSIKLYIQPLPKMKPFCGIIYEVENNLYVDIDAGFLAFDRITGIKENQKEGTAVVEYIEKVVRTTPFSRVTALDYDKYDITTSVTFERKANFRKYDDGWRIEK